MSTEPETENVRIPAGTPDEFQADIELVLQTEFPPDELRALRQKYSQDGQLEEMRDAAEDFIAEETPNREAYLDAMVAAFEEVLGDGR